MYSEAEDMKFTVQYSFPFAIKPILRKISQNTPNTVDFDNYVISEKSTFNSCFFRARFISNLSYKVLTIFRVYQ